MFFTLFPPSGHTGRLHFPFSLAVIVLVCNWVLGMWGEMMCYIKLKTVNSSVFLPRALFCACDWKWRILWWQGCKLGILGSWTLIGGELCKHLSGCVKSLTLWCSYVLAACVNYSGQSSTGASWLGGFREREEISHWILKETLKGLQHY